MKTEALKAKIVYWFWWGVDALAKLWLDLRIAISMFIHTLKNRGQ